MRVTPRKALGKMFSLFFLRHFIVFSPFSMPFSEDAFLRILDPSIFTQSERI